MTMFSISYRRTIRQTLRGLILLYFAAHNPGIKKYSTASACLHGMRRTASRMRSVRCGYMTPQRVNRSVAGLGWEDAHFVVDEAVVFTAVL